MFAARITIRKAWVTKGTKTTEAQGATTAHVPSTEQAADLVELALQAYCLQDEDEEDC